MSEFLTRMACKNYPAINNIPTFGLLSLDTKNHAFSGTYAG